MNREGTKVLGVDYGRRRIGLAISDGLGLTARPLHTVEGADWTTAIAEIAALAEDRDVVEILVGMPYNMDGTTGELAREAERFAQALSSGTGLEVSVWDERLSTRQADRVLRDASLSAAKRKKMRDALAAQIVLQSYLDAKRLAAEDEG